MKKILQNSREIVGWLTIGFFINAFLPNLPSVYSSLESRYFRLYFFVITTIFILTWLRLNNKKHEHI